MVTMRMMLVMMMMTMKPGRPLRLIGGGGGMSPPPKDSQTFRWKTEIIKQKTSEMQHHVLGANWVGAPYDAKHIK